MFDWRGAACAVRALALLVTASAHAHALPAATACMYCRHHHLPLALLLYSITFMLPPTPTYPNPTALLAAHCALPMQLGVDGGAGDPALRPFWRGRMGLEKEEQVDLFEEVGCH